MPIICIWELNIDAHCGNIVLYDSKYEGICIHQL